MKYICKYCNNEFIPNSYALKYNRVSKYCSHKCAMKDWRIQNPTPTISRMEKCIICDSEFLATRKKSKCCSKACLDKYYTKTHSIKKHCKFCGKEFLSFDTEYCSQRCANLAHIDKRPKAEFVELKCEFCGEIFSVNKKCQRLKNGNIPKFCSWKCYVLSKQKTKSFCERCGKPLKKKSLKFCSKECRKKPNLDNVCLNCGEKYNNRNKKFCSQKCHFEFLNINRVPIENKREYQKKYNKKYRILNKDKIQKKLKEKENNDPVYKMKVKVRKIICEAFKRRNCKKLKKSEELLGCSIPFFIQHISSQFKDGMSFENYGKWEIDHIIPLFTAKTIEEVEKLCHYSNLQPLWKEENLAKRWTDNIKYKENLKRKKY